VAHPARRAGKRARRRRIGNAQTGGTVPSATRVAAAIGLPYFLDKLIGFHVRRERRGLCLMPRRLLPLFCAGLLSTTTACRSEAPLPVVSSGADILLASDTELVRGLVPRQTTLDSLLRAQGLQSEVAGRVIAAAASVFDLRRLRANQPFVLERTPEGELRHFEYEIDQDRYLRVAVPQANDVRASVMPIQKEREDALAAGQISDATP